MFTDFVLSLRQEGVPASITEYLALLGAMQAGVADYSVDDFYYLARATLVKDERHIDRFDRVFARCFNGVQSPAAIGGEAVAAPIPEEWLRRLAERLLTPEERAQLAAIGGFDALMETLRRRLAEQQGRHEGGSKWIGTAGTSPFGAYGYNPEGVRIGQEAGRQGRAAKVWDQRVFRDLDDGVELGTRTMKLALRRLRRFARQGAATELDVPGTIRATAHNAGSLELKLQAERRNTVRLLLFLDIGGSMDEHVRVSEELFSAARREFKQLSIFYFHNCIYERVWTDNRRRAESGVATADLLRLYDANYRAIFVGDASMSLYELTMAGGSVEHWNAEPGSAWMTRLVQHWRRCAWLNPVPQFEWGHTRSIGIVGGLMAGRMFPLTLAGLEALAQGPMR